MTEPSPAPNGERNLSDQAGSAPVSSAVSAPSPARPLRRLFALFLQCMGAVALLAALLVVARWIEVERWARRDSRRAGAPASLRVDIKPGTSMRAVARRLEKAGIARPASSMMILVVIHRADTKLRAGEYAFAPGTPPLAVMRALIKGPESQSTKVTLPEGWSIEHMAQRLAEQKVIASRDRFLQACHDGSFLSTIDIPTSSAEGFLFPSTYLLLPATDEKEVIRRMAARFASEVRSLGLRPGMNSPDAFPLTYAQSIILASIIEREAADPEELALISSVFHNRLRLNMPLGSCATLRFALNKWDTPLTMDDLKTDSPLNTYVHAGLPPVAICNPGRAAINAAFRPAKSRFLYFVYKGNRRHEFSETLKEHEAARNKYKDLWLTPKPPRADGTGVKAVLDKSVATGGN